MLATRQDINIRYFFMVVLSIRGIIIVFLFCYLFLSNDMTISYLDNKILGFFFGSIFIVNRQNSRVPVREYF